MAFVDAVAFSPDGRRFAFSASNPYGPVTEGTAPAGARSGRRTRRGGSASSRSRGRRPGSRSVPDGRRLAASGPKGAELRDVETGAEIRTWPAVGAISFSPDGESLASCRNQRVTFWDARSGRLDARVPLGQRTRRHTARMARSWRSAARDAVELRDAASGRELRRLPHGPGDPQQRQTAYFGEDGPELAFSPDGRWLAVATDPPRVWDATTGELRLQLSGHDGTVQGIAFSPDGREIATAGVDSTIRTLGRADRRRASRPARALLLGRLRRLPSRGMVPPLRQPPGRRGQAVGPDPTPGAIVAPRDRCRRPSISTRTAGGCGCSAPTAGSTGATRRVRRSRSGPGSNMTQAWLTPAILAEFSGDGRRLATVAERSQAHQALGRRGRPRAGDVPRAVPQLHVPGDQPGRRPRGRDGRPRPHAAGASRRHRLGFRDRPGPRLVPAVDRARRTTPTAAWPSMATGRGSPSTTTRMPRSTSPRRPPGPPTVVHQGPRRGRRPRAAQAADAGCGHRLQPDVQPRRHAARGRRTGTEPRLDLGRRDGPHAARDPVGRVQLPPRVQPRRPPTGGGQPIEGRSSATSRTGARS